MRNRDWLGNFAKVQSSSITVLEEFPTYLACAGAHEGVVVKLEDEFKEEERKYNPYSPSSPVNAAGRYGEH